LPITLHESVVLYSGKIYMQRTIVIGEKCRHQIWTW